VCRDQQNTTEFTRVCSTEKRESEQYISSDYKWLRNIHSARDLVNADIQSRHWL